MLHETQAMQQFAEKAYYDYSMYVILDRALPHLTDGLKPVQRRILYAMSELGLTAAAKYKKSVRTVGDVLGKFHPHGDTACYEAMVLMAQAFSFRYPLIDGQGNFGSLDDPKSFAAMRYTESRLSDFSKVYLAELPMGTVDWQPNFDGSLEEPVVLPAQLPTLLLNGSSGIAVGMATDIPPHHLPEIVDACLLLLKNPKTTLDEICEIVQGPDYAVGCEINNTSEELKEIYRTGVGSIRTRAVYETAKGEIVITALPPQVSPNKVLEQIAEQMQAKKLPWVEDLRDESDQKNPLRLVIVPRSNRVDTDALMSHLFATTDLQKNQRVNMNVIGCDGRPQVKGLLSFLTEWLTFRRQTVRRRLDYRLEAVQSRLEVLAGLLIVYLNIDEVIALIRSEDEPKLALMQRFSLTERQADAILEIKLRQLAKLEEIKIKKEQASLEAERDELQDLLGSETRLTRFMQKELTELSKRYGDARRSICVERAPAQALALEETLPTENMTVVLSAKGWVRAGKGHDLDPTQLAYKAGDAFLSAAQSTSRESALFVDSTGRVYSVAVQGLPSARSLGEPLTTRLSPPAGAVFLSVLAPKAEDKVVFVSQDGYGFQAPASGLASKNKTGKLVLKTDAGMASPVILSPQARYLALLTQKQRLLVIAVDELPVLEKGRGNKLIALNAQEREAGKDGVVWVMPLSPQDVLSFPKGLSKRKSLNPKEWQAFLAPRGKAGKGV